MKGFRNLVCVSTLCFLLSGCVVSNHVNWYGEAFNPSAYIEDSIISYASLERNTKQLTLPPFFIFINQKGYQVMFTLHIKPEQYTKIDSINYQIWTKSNRLLMQSTLVRENEFKTFGGRGCVDLTDAYVSPLDPRKLKEDLWIDFTLYVQTPEKTQKQFALRKYPLKRYLCRGVVWFPF